MEAHPRHYMFGRKSHSTLTTYADYPSPRRGSEQRTYECDPKGVKGFWSLTHRHHQPLHPLRFLTDTPCPRAREGRHGVNFPRCSRQSIRLSAVGRPSTLALGY